MSRLRRSARIKKGSLIKKHESIIVLSDSDDHGPSPKKKRKTQSLEVIDIISDDDDDINETKGNDVPSDDDFGNSAQDIKHFRRSFYDIESSDEDIKPSRKFRNNAKIVTSDSDDDIGISADNIKSSRKSFYDIESSDEDIKPSRKFHNAAEIVTSHDDIGISAEDMKRSRKSFYDSETSDDDIKPSRKFHNDGEIADDKDIKPFRNLHYSSDEDIKSSRQFQCDAEIPAVKDIKPHRNLHYSADDDIKPPRKFLESEEKVDECIEPEWIDYELLAQQQDIKPNICKNLINLFSSGNTIPFIARYRRDQTENMPPERLREARDTFEEICQLRQKMRTVLKTVTKLGVLDSHLKKAVKTAKSLEELEIIYAPYKPGGKRTLAEKAKELGLEHPAQCILNSTDNIKLTDYVDLSKKDLSTVAGVEKGIIHIIAYILATDSDVLSFLREIRTDVTFMLEAKKSRSTKQPSTVKNDIKRKPIDEKKFEQYFDFKRPTKIIRPHQMLAINRGEQNKILSVKIVVPDTVFQKFSVFCNDKWSKNRSSDITRKSIMGEAIKDSYNRLVQPLLVREIRSELKSLAEKASYEVFSKNLKHLLLSAPLKGHSILAIDPGFTGGCKMALVSKTGTVLAYDWIYPLDQKKKDSAKNILRNMLKQNECSLIALGNGKACRETEEWLTLLIKQGFFRPLNVKYTIVSEDGASTYSCSDEAKKEFPKLDTNIISAVSLARRIQDPLAELVKIEPQHLGVGMYQHDLKKKTLEEALNEVVSECVSFVGVDLNTASQCLLRRIAGLSDKRATQIVSHREKNGPFLYRQELTKVFGIGERIFQQCAGFLRVGPTSPEEAVSFYKKPNTTKLDCTYIHPESYGVTNKLMQKFNLNPDRIGERDFITKVKSLSVNSLSLSKELNSPEETVKLILDALSKPLNYDLRSDVSQEPLFRQGLNSIKDLKIGTEVTGRVKNVTHFGCFIDIGVETDALLHQSNMKNIVLNIGNKVKAKVINLDKGKLRIGLSNAYVI